MIDDNKSAQAMESWPEWKKQYKLSHVKQENKMSEWTKVATEKTRTMFFKSQPGYPLELTNVTHFKRRGHGSMLKCDQGVVYFEFDDVSHIVSFCENWTV